MANITRWAIYFLSFGVGRGALFLAPLLLANFLVASEYGILETALAVASLSASTASLGTSGAIPLVLLCNNKQATMRGIILHQILVVAAAVSFAVVAIALNWPFVWELTALMTACLVMQGLASSHLKTLGYGDASILIDAGLLSLIVVVVLLVHYLEVAQPMDFVIASALIYALLLVVAYSHILVAQRREQECWAWIASIKVGVPLMLGGVVSLLATTSGRLGMGLLASPELTAVYAVLARAGALPIVAHQLITIARFRNLFAQSGQAVERAVLQIVLLVAASVLSFFVLCPLLGSVLGSAFVNAYSQHQLAGMLIVAQAVLWSAIALNDFVIARHQIMHKVLRYSIGFLAIALALGWLALIWSGLSLRNFVIVHSFVMLSFYLAQSWIMNSLGLHLIRVWVTTVALYLLLVLAAVCVNLGF